MKKRWLSVLMAALLALSLCTAAVSCKDPDDEPQGGNTTDETENDNEVNISDLIK